MRALPGLSGTRPPGGRGTSGRVSPVWVRSSHPGASPGHNNGDAACSEDTELGWQLSLCPSPGDGMVSSTQPRTESLCHLWARQALGIGLIEPGPLTPDSVFPPLHPVTCLSG